MTSTPSKSHNLQATATLASCFFLAAMAGCSVPVTGVVRLYDGLLKASTLKEAEAFCAMDGAPFRMIKPEDAALGAQQGVLFRCD